ncbi:MAG: redox-sensing transcriptional repressor Rex [Candidatus Omnitrophota bacterium]|nr:redox-sensing transcriptional repressor Rex [Candidatus Omnitrophota bacterium]
MPRDSFAIPQETARRLSLYLRSLKRLEQQQGVASSREITRFLNISSEQFRKDLSYFGEFGRRGIGYDIEILKKEIGKILGTNVVWRIVLVGVGKLGFALLGYPGFLEFNLQIIAAFDNDKNKIGQVLSGVKILNTLRMREVIKKEAIKIAMLCVPVDAAQDMAGDLARCGIKAILNFAPVNLVLPKNVCVSNVDMASELEGLVFQLKRGFFNH